MLAPRILTVCALTFMHGLALAETATTPPGDPCGTGKAQSTNGPCNNNNGNEGENGNAGAGIRYDRSPPPIILSMPGVAGRSAYVTQIGDHNRATVVQTATNAEGHIRQESAHNRVELSQGGTAISYSRILQQRGNENVAVGVQAGAGQNYLMIKQDGASNATQTAQGVGGSGFNGAILNQFGDRNTLFLTQTGSENRAILAQNGSGNALYATQSGNRDLSVVQTGSNLSLSVDQQHKALAITQWNPGQ